ncbi:hypothetical protein HOO54_02760 [Bacillus sp. WMMC1349]|uniref:hypothetical protein n=1 Tax=Bacillus sp. WMMC1349 TaxID=2736254 RepID=UPI00155270E5|nr:hypothetical protein [Bacillus sp. WMMC1349]NPC91201.1 hypothetical protein [Bacillus sp. WMMC1349]
MSSSRNWRLPGEVKVWRMTERERQAYIKKHPIIFREDLKPSPAFTMEKWDYRLY